MAKKLVIPAGFSIAFANNVVAGELPEAVPYVPHFRVRAQNAEDKVSDVVTLIAIHFNKDTRQILAFCSDGKTRKCNIDRLPNIETARALFGLLQTVGKKQTKIRFKAAGNFSPDTWFYTVEQQ